MHVAELWRYPVKSLAGERLDEAELLPDGFPGDRVVRVVDAGGEVVTARTKPGLLAISGADWETPGAARALAEAAGPGACFERGTRFFDESPLLVGTDGAVSALGYDGRRFRPNIVIGGVPGMEERGWDGRALRIGSDGAEVDLGHLCKRCVLTTFDPDTQEQDPDVLRRVNAELDGLFARNCWVRAAGRIAVGDAVSLI